MNRGTRVAQAYIAITADGSNIDDDIADAFDEVDWDEIGERTSKKYSKALQKNLEKDLGQTFDKTISKHHGRVAKAIARDDVMRTSVRDMVDKAHNNSALDDLYRHVARRAGGEYSGEFGKTVERLVKRDLREALYRASQQPGVRDNLDSILSRYSSSPEGRGETIYKLGPVVESSIRKAEKVLTDSYRRQTKEYVAFWEDALKERERDELAMTRRLAEFGEAQDRFAAEGKRQLALQRERDEKDRLTRQKNFEISNDKLVFDAKKRLYEQDQFEERSVRAAREAAKILSGIRIDPRVDRRAVERTRRELQRLLMDREGLQVRLSDVSPADRLRIERQIEAIDGKIEVYADHDRLRRSLLVAEGLVDRSGRRIVRRSLAYYQGRDMADRLGRLTGMGARNNFLNIVGRTIRMVTNLSFSAIRGVSSLTRGALEMGKAFQTGFQSAAQGASFFSRAGSGMAAMGARLAPMFASLAGGAAAAGVGLVALGVALVALTFISSVLVSTISALLGVVFALAGTLVSGLTAAVMVAGAAFVPLIAAGGAMVTMFMSMNDAQKKALKETFTPLREIFVGLGQTMLNDVIPAFETWSNNLQQAATLLIPLADKMGAVFAEAGTRITASLSGPGFQKLSAALGEHLPRIILSLSNAFGSLLNGLSGMFAALMPYVERFADYLARVTERFSQWANSAEGQNSIVDFVDRAWESLQSLWNFMREFFGWLRDIFFNPTVQEFGNKMFDGLADSFRRLRDNIADGSLEQWMADAERLGRQLWDTFTDLWDIFKTLNNSKVIEIVSASFEILGWVFRRVNDILEGFVDLMNGDLPDSLLGKALMFNPIISALTTVVRLIDLVMAGFKRLSESNFTMPGLLGKGLGALGLGGGGGGGGSWGGIPTPTPFADSLIDPRTQHTLDNAKKAAVGESWGDYYARWKRDQDRLSALRRSGASHLANTDRPDPSKVDPPEWVNPYKKWAESLIKEGPSLIKQIKTNLKKMHVQVHQAITEAVNATTGSEAREALGGMATSLRQQGKDFVDSARSTLNSAARALASASTPEAAAEALASVKKAQRDLAAAQKNQRRLNSVAKILNAQRSITSANVNKLLSGARVRNATLADYARAQERLAVRIENAKEKLAEAISIRDEYAKSVADSIRTFGALTTAQVKVVDGVSQALTATDITTNLQSRLDQIRKFQHDLRALQVLGISDAAYKQIIDAGVEEGGAFAQALLEGGVGAVSETNKLTAEIDKVAKSMGLETSNTLYQAGVDAAKGLVDGLTSLSAQLESAAFRLGNSIAKQVAKALGIKSPSRVLMDQMGSVGDGAVLGLDAQHNKVADAVARLAGTIQLAPTAAMPASAQSGATSTGSVDAVSGNRAEHHWHITTPSEDPRAVAWELLNEVTVRI